MPDKTLKKFLEDAAKCELAQQEIMDEMLEKYTLPKSRFWQHYFPQLEFYKMPNEIVKVVHDREKSPDEAEVIARRKHAEATYFRFTMRRSEGKWLISDYAATCCFCQGNGCELCEDGWVVEI